MKTFQEWCEIRQRQDEGFGKNVALGAALTGGALGGGLGLHKLSQTSQKTTPQAPQIQQVTKAPQAPQIQQGEEDMLGNNHKSWNSEIGDFRVVKQQDGSIIYKTAKGNFKKVPSQFSSTGYKFVKI